MRNEAPAPAARLALCASPDCLVVVDLDRTPRENQHKEVVCWRH